MGTPNAELARRGYDALNLQDWEALQSVVTPDTRAACLAAGAGAQSPFTLRERWGATGGDWFPIDRPADAPPPPDAEAFDAERFPEEDLRAALASLGVTRLFQVAETPAESAELDLSLLDPVYDFEEKFWLAADGARVVYASHESTLTVAGAELLRALRARSG